MAKTKEKAVKNIAGLDPSLLLHKMNVLLHVRGVLQKFFVPALFPLTLRGKGEIEVCWGVRSLERIIES